MRLKALVIAALAVTFLAGVAVADSPVGTWTGETGEGEPFSIVIRESDGMYTGSAAGPQGSADLSDIAFADGELSFIIHIEIEGQEAALSVEGAVDGNSFDGRVEIPNAGEFPITMTREPVVELGNPVGTWKVETGEGEPFGIVIRESGGIYSGTATGPAGSMDLSDIAFADGTLSFTIHFQTEGQEVALSVEGAVDGDYFDGFVEIPNAGDSPISMTRESAVELTNPIGTWIGLREHGDPYFITIAGSAGAYTGTLDTGAGPLDLANVSFVDGELSFAFSVESNGEKRAFTATGTINGDSLKGSVTIPGEGESPISLTRKLIVDLSNAIGTWHATIDGAPATLNVSQSSSRTPVGTIETSTGVADLSEVAFLNQRLSFSVRLERGNGWMLLKVTGLIQGDDYGANVNVEDLGTYPLHFSRTKASDADDSEDSGASSRSSDSGRSVGDWDVAFDIRGNSRNATLTIAKNDDGTLSGNWSSQLGMSDLRDVRDDGNSLTFNRTLELDGHSIDLSYSATIDGNAIHGTIATGQFGDIPFEGQRIGGGLAALAGTWNLAIDASGNPISITLNIAEEEGVVTGTWGSNRFGEAALKDATYEEGAIAFAVAIDTPNGEFKVSFSGSVEGSELSGRLESDFGVFPVTGTKVE